MSLGISMSNVKNISYMCVQVTPTHTFQLKHTLQPSEPWLMETAKMKHFSDQKVDRALHLLFAQMHTLERMHVCLYSIAFYRHTLNHCIAGPSKHCHMGEFSHKYRPIIRSKQFLPKSLAGHWLKKKREKHFII